MTSIEQSTVLRDGSRWFTFPSTQEHFDSLRSLQQENVDVERFRQRLEAWTGTRVTAERDLDYSKSIWFTRHDNGGEQAVTIELIQGARSWDELVRAVARNMTQNASSEESA